MKLSELEMAIVLEGGGEEIVKVLDRRKVSLKGL